MLDLWSSRRIGSTRWMLSSAVTFATVVLSFLDVILFNVRQSLSLSFGFRPQVLVPDYVFLWFVYAVKTIETAAMDTAAVLVTYAPAKRSLKIWQVSQFALLSYEMLLNTICNALKLALHRVNKQKNNARYSQLMFSQWSQHTQFYSHSTRGGW